MATVRRRRYQPAKNTNSAFTLNITSMTDMFTILLVFLLQTYSTAEINVDIDKGLRLPSSSSEANPIQAVQISLTKDELKIENKSFLSLSNLDFAKKDLDPQDDNFITPLFKELQQIAEKEKQKAKPDQGILEGRLLLKADEQLSYNTIRRVMYTASMAGFPKLKIATVVGQ